MEKIDVRDLCINDDDTITRQAHDQVGLRIAFHGLHAEVAMRAHAGCLNDAPQSLLTPSAARLIRLEHHPELLRFVGERLALLREQFELLLYLAERRGLGGFALLQLLA